MLKKKMMELCEYDTIPILYCLREGLTRARHDFDLLLISKERDLTSDERGELPSTLVELTREQLREQIDPWYSLVVHYEYLVHEFDPDNWL